MCVIPVSQPEQVAWRTEIWLQRLFWELRQNLLFGRGHKYGETWVSLLRGMKLYFFWKNICFVQKIKELTIQPGTDKLSNNWSFSILWVKTMTSISAIIDCFICNPREIYCFDVNMIGRDSLKQGTCVYFAWSLQESVGEYGIQIQIMEDSFYSYPYAVIDSKNKITRKRHIRNSGILLNSQFSDYT